MDKLFYSLMLDKHAKRSMKMLLFLYEAQKPVAVSQLIKSLGISEKTFSLDLARIESKLPQEICVTKSHTSIELKYEKRRTIELFIIDYAVSTIAYKILEFAFNGKTTRIDEFAKSLYISKSTLRIRISLINKMLKAFNCRLSLTNIEMLGREIDIRYFYYQFFSDFQTLFNFSEDYYLNLMCDNYDLSQLKSLLNHDYKQLVRFLYVAQNRCSSNHYVKVDDKLIKKVEKRNSYQNFKTIYNEHVGPACGMFNLSENETVWAYIAGLSTIVYTYANNKPGINYFRREADNIDICQKASYLLADVFALFDIQVCQLQDFIEMHLAFIVNNGLMMELTNATHFISPEIKIYVETNLNELFTIWQTIYPRFVQAKVVKKEYLEQTCAKLALITSQFVYNSHINQKSVMYFFIGDDGFSAHLQAVVKKIFPAHNSYFVYSDLVSQEQIDKHQVDIVVCNYIEKRKFKNCELVVLSHIPTTAEWQYLHSIIFDLKKD